MAGQAKIEFISDGFRQILLSDGVRDLVQQTADEIKDRADANISEASEGFSSKVWQGGYGGGRWVGSVTTTDATSMAAEAEDKALSKAVM